MNHIHRTVWNPHRGATMAVSETAHSRCKSQTRTSLITSVLLGVMASGSALADGPPGATLPTGAQVTAGQARIAGSGNTLTVTQGSSKAAINWQSFSIGKDATVKFVQPNAAAVALNRVTGREASVIDGSLTANGQVFVLNPNGVLFGKGARVDTAGLVASTLNLSDADFLAGKLRFGGDGRSSASVVNQGQLNARDGGYVALLGQQVRNDGTISARLGTVALAAGNKLSLNFNGDALVGVTLEEGALQALVANGGAVRADGGLVLLTAKAADGLLNAVVNNSGEIRAQTVAERGGKIYLLGDMQGGTVQVGGTLDASAPNGGNGGFIETSAANVRIGEGATVTTRANSSTGGSSGTWLIDPTDFNISAGSGVQSGSGIGATTLQTALGAGNVTIQTQATGTEDGNININAPLSWSANLLTLEAHGNINVNAVVSATGSSTLNLKTGYNFNTGSPIFNTTKNVLVGIGSNSSFTGRIDFDRSGTGLLTINNAGYTLINALGNPGSTTRTDLQGINGGTTGKYALAGNIDASATSGWNSGQGFTALTFGTGAVFDGLGHTISGLTINQPSGSYVGLFGQTSGTIRNVGMTGASVAASQGIGLLAGLSMGALINNTVSGTVSGPSGYIGGLVGAIFDGTNTNLHSAGTVTSAGNNVGGLAGYLAYHILLDNSTSSANVTGTGTWTGGLIGQNDFGYINNSSASGTVSGRAETGGLAGSNNSGRITGSSATGAVTGTTSAGGLVGYSNNGQVTGSYASGVVNGTSEVGGLIGKTRAAGGATAANTISTSYATGSVISIGSNVGGLIGLNTGNTVKDVYARGSIEATGDNVGGLIGNNSGAVSNAYATGYTSSGGSGIGGLVGTNSGTIANSFWDRQTTGQNTSAGGGLSKTSAEMKVQTLYTDAVWNFTFHSGVWGRKDTLNDGYPVLRTFGYTDPITITLNNAALSKSYGPTNPALGASGWTVSGCDNNLTCLAGVDWGSAVTATAAAGTTYSYLAPNVLVPTFGAGYGKPSDYEITFTSGALTVNQAVLTVTGTTALGKIYDGNTAATVNAGSLVGLANGETLTLSASGGEFDNANAGNRTASATLAIGNGSGVNAGLASNYQLASATATGLNAVISARPVTVTAYNSAQKVYDGSTALDSNMLFLGNLVSNDSVSLSGSGALASRDVGNPALTGVGSLALDNGNYTLVGATLGGIAMVVPRLVDISSVNGASRAYDGTTAVDASLLQINNIASGDSVALSGSATLADKNVGTRAVASLAGLGIDNSNYTLVEASTAATVTIAPRTLNLSFSVAERVFDGSTTAVATVSDNRIAGEQLGVAFNAAYADPNAASAKPVLISGLVVSGGDAGNYVLAGNSGSGVTGNVLARPISFTLAPVNPGATFTANGQTLFTPATLDQLVTTSFANTVPGFSAGSISYTIWRNGQQVAQVAEAGSYELRATLTPLDANYLPTPGASIDLLVAASAAPIGPQVAFDIAQPYREAEASRNEINSTLAAAAPVSPIDFNPTPINVLAPLPGLALTFGEGTALRLVGAPAGSETTQAVSMAQARSMLQAPGSGGDRDVRVPVARNSLIEIVNGGVRLPGGVDQLLFVVADRGEQGGQNAQNSQSGTNAPDGQAPASGSAQQPKPQQ